MLKEIRMEIPTVCDCVKAARHLRKVQDWKCENLPGRSANVGISILVALAQAENQRLSLKQLCADVTVTQPTCVAWIQTLATKKLLTRVTAQVDKRRVFVELADAGCQLLIEYSRTLTDHPDVRQELPSTKNR
jgi:DNA-binding MarR family transcriptional regulator